MASDHHDFNSKQQDGAPSLFLSLFLLLLVFFVLLNFLTTLDETKSKNIMNSLSSTFIVDEPVDMSMQIVFSDLTASAAPKDIISEVKRIWKVVIPLTKFKTVMPGREMEMTLPVSELYLHGEATMRTDRQNLMKVTADALSAHIEGFTAVMFFSLGTPDLKTAQTSMGIKSNMAEFSVQESVVNLDDPSEALMLETALNDSDLSFARMTDLANKIIAVGAPPYGVSVGLRNGDTKNIHIRFTVFSNDNLYNSFSDLVEK